MNKLFKTGQYVLLSDCEAYDNKYALYEGTTKWAVAEKMQGDKDDISSIYMELQEGVSCVGISDGDVGMWYADYDLFERLSVEDVLYASEGGLTLDELSGIPCAYIEGREYFCTSAEWISICKVGETYKSGSKGLMVANLLCDKGSMAKFKLVSSKDEWVPTVGEELLWLSDKTNVFTHTKIIHIEDESAWLDGEGVVPHELHRYKQINGERITACKKAEEVWRATNGGVSGSEARAIFEALYDAGMLKGVSDE